MTTPAQERDRLEALSLKYSNYVTIILRLSSGNWALFDSSRQLIAIAGNADDLLHIAAAKSRSQPTTSTTPPQSIDLEELDL